MSIKRLPITFLFGGVAFKALLVFLWKLWHLPLLANVLIYYDPGARYFAEEITRLFFDYGGLTLAPGAPRFYEVVLVIGFGIECLLVGLLAQWVLRRFTGRVAQVIPSRDRYG